jgi:serine/threonine-protein kinase
MSLVGKSIGRYRILEQLGQGGMAVVYKAYDTRLERDVALKVIRTENIPPSQLSKLMQRFDREAKAQARFNHSNIVQIHDYGEYEGAPYLVIAYLPGGTLKQQIGQPMPYFQAAQLLTPIADAVAYAHARGVLHRDVKPSNILITEEGKPVLTDFGIAKILEAEGTELTGTGMGVGTPAYMAPEQWRGEPVPQTDIYGLGVVFFELITGRKPYEADTPAAVAILQVTEALPRPTELVGEIPEKVEKVLFKALALKPEDRYVSMAEFGKVLAELGQEAKVEIDKDTPISVEAPIELEPAPKPVIVSPEDEVETFDDLLTQTDMEQEQKRFPCLWVGLGLLFAVVVIGGGIGLAMFGNELATREITDTATISTTITMTTSTETLVSTITQTQTMVNTPASTSTPMPTSTPLPHTSTPTLEVDPSFMRTKDSMEMGYVPAGEFSMGSKDGESDQSPVHTVYLDAFYIDKHEVTLAQFAQFVDETNYVTTAEERGWSYVLEGDTWRLEDGAYWREPGWKGEITKEQSPVIHVSWIDARMYCEWAGGRLPTEAEWEKAARGGLEGQLYPWGNEAPVCTLGAVNGAQYKKCEGQTMEVASFAGNGYGLFDMSGNVWEWVADWYDGHYYADSPDENPTGPSDGKNRVLRGGSWNYDQVFLQVTYRFNIEPDNTFNFIGFRCASGPN